MFLDAVSEYLPEDGSTAGLLATEVPMNGRPRPRRPLHVTVGRPMINQTTGLETGGMFNPNNVTVGYGT